jgi:hypothetical protein
MPFLAISKGGYERRWVTGRRPRADSAPGTFCSGQSGPASRGTAAGGAEAAGASPRLLSRCRDYDPVAGTTIPLPGLRSCRRDYGRVGVRPRSRAETAGVARDCDRVAETMVLTSEPWPATIVPTVKPQSRLEGWDYRARAAALAGCSRSGERDGQEVSATDHGGGVSVRDVLHHDIPHFVIDRSGATARAGCGGPNGLRKPSGPRGSGARVCASIRRTASRPAP